MQAKWLKPPDEKPGEARPRGVWAPPPDGQPLWFHRIPVFRRPDELESLCDVVDDLLGLGCDQAIHHRRPDARVSIFPGNGTSVIVADAGDAAELSDVYARIVALQTAYWTLGQELGSEILWVSNHFAVLIQDAAVEHLRQQADHLIWLNQEFTLYQALLTEHVTRLAPEDGTRWESLAATWGLEPFLQQLDKRLGDFGQLVERVLQRLQGEATSRLNEVVMVLTIVSGVSAVAALAGFATGAVLRHVRDLNIIVIAVAAVVLTILVLSLTTAFRFNVLRRLTARLHPPTDLRAGGSPEPRATPSRERT